MFALPDVCATSCVMAFARSSVCFFKSSHQQVRVWCVLNLLVVFCLLLWRTKSATSTTTYSSLYNLKKLITSPHYHVRIRNKLEYQCWRTKNRNQSAGNNDKATQDFPYCCTIDVFLTLYTQYTYSSNHTYILIRIFHHVSRHPLEGTPMYPLVEKTLNLKNSEGTISTPNPKLLPKMLPQQSPPFLSLPMSRLPRWYKRRHLWLCRSSMLLHLYRSSSSSSKQVTIEDAATVAVVVAHPSPSVNFFLPALILPDLVH